MRQQLWRCYPQFLDAVDDDVAAPWAHDLWRSLPTPRAGQRVREVTLTRVLKQHRIRRTDAATLRATAVKVAPGAVEAAVITHVQTGSRTPRPGQPPARSRAPRARRVGGSTRRGCSGGRPGRVHGSRGSVVETAARRAILLSVPGIRTKVLATLPAEGRNAVQRRDYEALRCLCGVAPVSHPAFGQEPGRDAASGGPRPTARRRLPLGPASPPNAIRSARTSIRRYAPRGHGHARALRSVADRLLNVACAMLRDGACFDPRGVGITAT